MPSIDRILECEYHRADVQAELIAYGAREEIIDWLTWNDRNGAFTDVDSVREGMKRLTLESARELMREIVDRESNEE